MKRSVKTIIYAVLLVGIIVLGYLVYDTLFSPYYFAQEKASKYEDVKTRMRDIIEAQEAYKKANNNYASSFDELISVLKNDSIMVVRTIGSESDTIKAISIDEALELFEIDPSLDDSARFERIQRSLNRYNEQLRRTGGDAITTYVVQDTSYVPIRNTLNIKAPIDSLKYIPHSGGETFSLETNVLHGGAGQRVRVPVYEVIAYNDAILKGEDRKYYKRKEGIKLGSVYEATTNIVDIRIRDEE